MESPFIYSKPVTGKNNIGRRQDAVILANFIHQGENVAIWEPPKTGKMSLVNQTFINMKVATRQFIPIEFNLLSIRTIADFATGLGSAVIRGASRSPEEYPSIVNRYLAGTNFTYDPEVVASGGPLISLKWDIGPDDIKAVLGLPYQMAKERGQKVIVVLREFQNVMLTEDGEMVCSILHSIFDGATPEVRRTCSYLFMGSEVNAMKDIFEVRRLFYRRVEHLKLSPIDPKEIIDHIVRGFLSSGKVLDRELMLGVCKLFKGNVCYIQHFAAICDTLSKGYMLEPVLLEALDMLISIHTPRFEATMNGLTTFQLCLLRAILDGHTKFSSSEVIQRYNLNSSANVRRLKDALCKKEIVTFNEKDEPEVLDPLFEYWARKYFFGISEK